jgi:hypothetical protein
MTEEQYKQLFDMIKKIARRLEYMEDKLDRLLEEKDK